MDTGEWLNILDRYGFPVAALVAISLALVMLAFWTRRAVIWLAANVVIPLKERFVAYLDKQDEATECLKESNQQQAQLLYNIDARVDRIDGRLDNHEGMLKELLNKRGP